MAARHESTQIPSGKRRATIVVPSFQQGRFLPNALRSIVAQTEGSIESLVYDNCSEDDTRSVLASFSGHLTRITIEKDRGQSSALNRGFREARGDIIGWLNADDILMPNAVERALHTLDQTGADVVYGQCAHLDASGQFTGYFPFARPFDEGELRDYNNFLPQPATFFRRSLLDRVGLLDEELNYTMDWDLWCRFARAGARFQFVPEVWAGARVHKGAKTSRGGLRRLVEVCKVNMRHRTQPAPLVPILYAAHRANRALALQRLPRLRDWWRAITGENRSTAPWGIAQGSLIVSDPARLIYPVFEYLNGLTVDLDDADYAPASILVNGRAMTRTRRTYEMRTPGGEVVNSLEVEISQLHRPLPAPFTVQHTHPGTHR